MYVNGIYDGGAQELGGLGKKLKKVVKKVEKATRPLVKVAAVVGTAMYAPNLLPAVAGAALKGKSQAQPAEPLQMPQAESVPMVPPAAITTTVPFQAPALPKPQMPAMQTFAPGEMVTAGAGPGMMRIADQGQAAGQAGGMDTQKLIMYGLGGLGALGLLYVLSQQRPRR